MVSVATISHHPRNLKLRDTNYDECPDARRKRLDVKYTSDSKVIYRINYSNIWFYFVYWGTCHPIIGFSRSCSSSSVVTVDYQKNGHQRYKYKLKGSCIISILLSFSNFCILEFSVVFCSLNYMRLMHHYRDLQFPL